MDRLAEAVLGFIGSLVLGVLAALILSAIDLSVGIFFIGLVQLLYIIPLCIYYWNRHRGAAQGLIIGASLIFLLNSLCWGILAQL
ncbi:hypothetical protein J31TS4_18110 [Paenibacillus sp. J31TS4]|uniref:hypothetical protein n=1 Tax=Paenibacillus sp. J31TS4 TaxID=2807195 RepID=UPI001B20E67E|nr:hypothetical protein [Paenibacillus sp. J31TS4]GIP38531.1 hypothetical protein J31TS4_18110 [Paenibacillus sp. J31TS4]